MSTNINTHEGGKTPRPAGLSAGAAGRPDPEKFMRNKVGVAGKKAKKWNVSG